MTNQLCRHSLRSAAAILAVFVFSVVDNYAAAGPGQGGGSGWSPSQIIGQGIVVKPPGVNTLEVRSIANGTGILWDFPDGIGGNPSARINANANDFAFPGGILSLNSNRVESVRAFTNINFMYLFQQTTPVTPDPGHTAFYTKSDGMIYKLSSDGIELMLGGGGGGGGSTSDSVYGPAWNGVTTISPSQNAVFDKIETLGTNLVNNSAFGSGWQGQTNRAPSQDALYNKMTNFVTGTNAAGWGGNGRIVRTLGTAGAIQGSVVDLSDNGTFTFPNGIRQTFSPSTINSGFNVGSVNAVQLSSGLNGDMWYHSGASALKAQVGNQVFTINMKDSLIPELKAFKAGSPAATFNATEDTDAWLFGPDAPDQFVQWQTALPTSFTIVGWGLELTFTMSTGTTGNVIWGAQVMAVTPSVAEDANSAGYAAATLSSAVAVQATVGAASVATVQLTNADSAAAGSVVKIRIFRDADNASDTATGNAELIGVRMAWVRGNQ